MIPLIDLKKQYQEIKGEIDKGVLSVFARGNFILGDEVFLFEKSFAKFAGVKYCIATASGTDAILLGLRALGVGKGDEVIVQDNTFISTVLPIAMLGAKPVLVDADPKTYQVDVKEIKKHLGKKTKAIIPVHLYGSPAPIEAIVRLAKRNKIAVLEDAAQAHGATFKNKMCGSFGTLGAYSFYPGKNLGAAGDAGAIVTNNAKLAKTLTAMRNIGQFEKYKHDIFGYNSRLDTIQAVTLSVKLKHLKQWNGKRRNLAKIYGKYLLGLPVTLPPGFAPGAVGNYHLYVIRVAKRDMLLDYLRSKGIHCGIHYPVPIHLQKSMKFLGYKKGDFPVSEKYAKEILSLPMYPELTEKEVKYICGQIRQFFKK